MKTIIYLLRGIFLISSSPTFSSGTIILLNGPSASGKSSIQNDIQKQFDELYLKVGIDTFFDSLLPTPDLSLFEEICFFAQYTKGNELIRSVELKKDGNGNAIVPLTIGPAGDQIISGMHSAIASYASKNNNLVVDYILYKPEWISDLINSLKNEKVYLIGIKAPLEVLEEREKKRATSPIGHARSHFETVHHGMIYDLELDVSLLSPSESAMQIKSFIKKNPNPQALKQLVQQNS